jgi:hypothetical protein
VDFTSWAGIAYGIAAIGVVAFQVALALGAPWGAYAMGGAIPGPFPARLRVAAAVQAALLALTIAIVASRAGLALATWSDAAGWLVWVVVAIAALALVLNSISRSAGERRIWVPVTVVMLACSLTVALTAA